MSLEAGSHLGPYEILAPIGAGGMGEVYKAKDTRLERTVAIKVLPEHVAEDSERKARFEREAKVISQLNHPHICTLYDIGEQDGVDYLVMEFIEGQTLAERLSKGALPLEQALEYGLQIGDGLDRAHRAGIVHRDLKPANVMLTSSGVKILDFGLATVVHHDAVSDSSDAPTQQKDLTQEHAVMGTLQYMAPEQLEGKPVDTRADVWAFGLVLSEMVTGRKVFDGDSQASLIGAILHTEPARLSAVEPKAPASLDWAVGRCLAKNADERWQTMRDLVAELKRPAPELRVHSSPARSRLVPALAVVTAVALLGAMVAWSSRGVTTPPTTTRFILTTAEDAPPTNLGAQRNIAVSPDGSRIAYASVQGIYVRQLGEIEPTPLRGGEGGNAPFFSPDGNWIGFLHSRMIKKVPAAGGAPTPICTVGDDFRGASWGADDTIVFSSSHLGLMRVAASGGTPTALTTAQRLDEWPAFLPSGNAVVFATGAAVSKRLALISLDTGTITDLGLSGSHPHYASTGHLLFVSQGGLHAIEFHQDEMSTSGSSRPVIENIQVSWETTAGQFAVARNGTLVYETSAGKDRVLVWVDRRGGEERLPLPTRGYYWPRVSPDGRRIAVDIEDDDVNVWIADVDSGTLTALTTDAADDRFPIWTPDGNGIVFASSRGGGLGLYSTIVDGRGVKKLLVTDDEWRALDPYSWSPNGETFIFSYQEATWGLGLLTLKGEPEWSPLFDTSRGHGQPMLSPDGKWITYVFTGPDGVQVFVEPFPVLGDRLQVSVKAGSHPVWSPDGREIFYRTHSAPRQVMSVAIDTAPVLRAGAPVGLFADTYFRGNDRTYDISPDGERFLMVKELTGGTDIVVVLNWFQELERLVPTETE